MSSDTAALGFAWVAFFYGMVGHGGASGYLALGALLGQPLAMLKTQALVLNLGVAGVASLLFWQAGHLRARLLLPLLLGSVPTAYVAARLSLPQSLAQALLALALIAAALRLFFHAWLRAYAGRSERRETSPGLLLGLGAVLGFLAGLTGVGGGIYLSPLLILGRWADVKETAACAAAFIWFNSMSSLVGHLQLGASVQVPAAWLLGTLACGAAGAWLGAGWAPRRHLARLLAVVLLLAAIKLGGQALS